MPQAKKSKANVPGNRIEPYLSKPNPQGDWMFISSQEENPSDPFFLNSCKHSYYFETKTGAVVEGSKHALDWTKQAQRLVERVSLENRIEFVEREIKKVSDRLTRIEGLCERAIQKPVCVPISTFAPDPFDIIKGFSVVVQPDEGSFVATLFDANISSSGETQEEAVANVKDLIIMIFQGFESGDDSELGPAMIRQKHALLSLIRRK